MRMFGILSYSTAVPTRILLRCVMFPRNERIKYIRKMAQKYNSNFAVLNENKQTEADSRFNL